MNVKECYTLHPDPAIRKRLLECCRSPRLETAHSFVAVVYGFVWANTQEGPAFWEKVALCPWGPVPAFSIRFPPSRAAGYAHSLSHIHTLLNISNYTFHLYPGDL